MARVRGFTLSQQASYKLWREGVDTRYWKGIPVVAVPPQLTQSLQRTSTRRARQRSTRQLEQQYAFSNYLKIYQTLSPNIIALLRDEAKYYDMTAKDLYTYLMMKFFNYSDIQDITLLDLMFFEYQNRLYIDILTTSALNLSLANLRKIPPPLNKYEKRRGIIKKCIRPADNRIYYYYKYPVTDQSNYYNLSYSRKTQYYRKAGPKTFKYKYRPMETYAPAWTYVYQNWSRVRTTTFQDWAMDTQSFSTIDAYNTEITVTSYWTVLRYNLSNVPNLQKYKAIILTKQGEPYSESKTGEAGNFKQAYFIISFGKGAFFIPSHHPFIMFPRIPKSYELPNNLYLTIAFPPAFSIPEQLVAPPSTPGTNQINRTILYSSANKFQLKLLKGRYRVYRMYCSPPAENEYLAVTYQDKKTREIHRLSPIMSTSRIRQRAFKIQPPAQSFYEQYDAVMESLALYAAPAPNSLHDVLDPNWERKRQIHEILERQKRATQAIWDDLYKQHLQQNPNDTIEF